MDEMIKGFPNKLMLKLSNMIMLDPDINKALYYNKVKDKDLYSLPPVENPISSLKDNKVFIDRRIDKVQKESDISIFINLSNDESYTKRYQTSRFFRTCRIEIGVICHSDCRKTLNGTREGIVIDKIIELLANAKLGGIGEATLEPFSQLYNMPFGYTGYSAKISVDYFNTM
ncbi:hypothetical protein H9L25_00920 [Terrisporobacter mayombei]|nr:hypothetical protein [Terrisporobacter mayombei]